VATKQPTFTYDVNGRVLTGSFFIGGEFCSYCASTRWGLIVALARFGAFNKLYDMSSSASDLDPNTPTFTFCMSTYTSSHLVFTGYEIAGPTGQPHMKTPERITKLYGTYDPGGGFPFADFGNKMFLAGSSFDPGALAGLTRDEIAANLTDVHDSFTQAIVTEANYVSAGICSVDGSSPARICNSPGVAAAELAMHQPH
jgi:hypothetical protein